MRQAVREYSDRNEAKGVTHGGAFRSENASTSNRNAGEIPARRKHKVSYSTVIRVGLVGPKGMAKAAPDGQQVNIPAPAHGRWRDGAHTHRRLIGLASAL